MAVLPLLLQTKAGACRHKDCAICLGKFYTFFMQVLQKRIVVIIFYVLEASVLTLQSCDRSLKN